MRREFGRYAFELSGQVRHRLGVCGHSGGHVLGQAVNHNHHGVQIMRQGQDLVVFVELVSRATAFRGTGHVQRRIISWELARGLRRDLTRQWLDAVYG